VVAGRDGSSSRQPQLLREFARLVVCSRWAKVLFRTLPASFPQWHGTVLKVVCQGCRFCSQHLVGSSVGAWEVDRRIVN